MTLHRYLPILAVLLVLVFGISLSGCRPKDDAAYAGQAGGQYFRMNLGSEPPTLDPAACDDLVSMTVLANISRGLVQYGPGGKIIPAYAQRWEESPDGKRYVFHLRKDGKWSDGKPVTAHDFIYAWRRVLDPKTGSSYAFLLFDIANGKALYDGNLKDPSRLGLRAPDPYTLEVTLDRPIAYFLQIMAFSISYPLRQDMVRQYPTTFTEAGRYITNGPYTLAQWQHESQILLKPDPHYWDTAPQVPGVMMYMIPEPNTSLIMYENGELDFAETTSSLPAKEVRRLKGRPDFHQRKLHAISYFGFNVKKPPFDDPRVRKAFIHAFDRTYIPKLFQGGEVPIASWITPGLFGYNPTIGLQFNTGKAKQLLEEAGYGQHGKPFPKVELLYASTTPENRQVAEIAQYQWRKNLNTPVELQNVEWKVFLRQLREDPPQIFRIQWYVDYPDPDSFMNVFIAPSGNNYTKWTDSRYDRWVTEAAVEQNPEKRTALYDQAQKLLLEKDAVILPLYVLPKSYLLNPKYTGFELNELNIVQLDRLRRRAVPEQNAGMR